MSEKAIWNKDFTVDELVEIIKSDLNIDGWKGAVCLGCKPKQEAPYPATVNLPQHVEEWKCPRCSFVNIFTWRKKKLPVFLHPDYGAFGTVIISAYEQLELNLDFNFEDLKEKP